MHGLPGKELGTDKHKKDTAPLSELAQECLVVCTRPVPMAGRGERTEKHVMPQISAVKEAFRTCSGDTADINAVMKCNGFSARTYNGAHCFADGAGDPLTMKPDYPVVRVVSSAERASCSSGQ